MALALPANNGPTIQPCPSGVHIARCWRVIDLGTQKTDYKGQQKEQHKVMFSFEIPSERKTYVDRDGVEHDQPFNINKTYTLSSYEKATLRQHLESWNGGQFSNEDLAAGAIQPKNFIGKACTVTIVHKVSEKNSNTYAKLEGIGPMMKGVAEPNPENAPVYFELSADSFDQSVFDSLHEEMQKQIRAAPEFFEIFGSGDKQIHSNDPARDPALEGGYSELNPPPPSEDQYSEMSGGR